MNESKIQTHALITVRAGEIPIELVLEKTGIPRRTVFHYKKIYAEFLSTNVRKPDEENPGKRAKRRVLVFDEPSVQKLNVIKVMSSAGQSRENIKQALRRDENLSQVTARTKLLPLVLWLQRSGTTREIGDITPDYDFSVFAEATAYLENLLGIEFPLKPENLSDDKALKLDYYLNRTFHFYFKEGKSGKELADRLRDYVTDDIAVFESCREFERYLLGKSEAPEIKKDVELLAFELVESAGIQPAVVIGFMEGILFKFPVPLLGKKASVRAWVNLIRLVRHYRTRIVNGITDDLINRVGREWRESLDL